jgi:hypothetical protein
VYGIVTYAFELDRPPVSVNMADADGSLDERGVLLEEKACEEFSCPLFVGMQPLGAGQGNQAHHLGDN